MYKTHATIISNTVFFKHKYLNHPAISPAGAILAVAVNMAAQLRGHHTRHLSADQLRNLKNLHSIFANSVATNATNTPTPRNIQTSDYGVLAPQAGDAAGPNLDAVAVLLFGPRPALTPGLPPKLILLPRATPLQVSPFPRLEQERLPAQAHNTSPRQRVPTTPTASRGKPPRRSPRPMNASSTADPPTTTLQLHPTRLAALRANLADRDEQNAARPLCRAQLPPTEQL